MGSSWEARRAGQMPNTIPTRALNPNAIIAANPDQVAQYRSGKDKLFGFFVGQVMKATGGKANPGQVNQILKQKLSG